MAPIALILPCANLNLGCFRTGCSVHDRVTQAATVLPASATLLAEAGGYYIYIDREQTAQDTNFAATDETVKWRLTRLSSCAGFQRPFRRDMEANKMSKGAKVAE